MLFVDGDMVRGGLEKWVLIVQAKKKRDMAIEILRNCVEYILGEEDMIIQEAMLQRMFTWIQNVSVEREANGYG